MERERETHWESAGAGAFRSIKLPKQLITQQPLVAALGGYLPRPFFPTALVEVFVPFGASLLRPTTQVLRAGLGPQGVPKGGTEATGS